VIYKRKKIKLWLYSEWTGSKLFDLLKATSSVGIDEITPTIDHVSLDTPEAFHSGKQSWP
jgi:hypothetical protein